MFTTSFILRNSVFSYSGPLVIGESSCLSGDVTRFLGPKDEFKSKLISKLPRFQGPCRGFGCPEGQPRVKPITIPSLSDVTSEFKDRL